LKVILLQDVPKIGRSGEVKDVKDGYARNYLIPRGLAKVATESELKRLRQEKVVRKHKEEILHQRSMELLKELQKGVHKISVKTGSSGKLFGSLTSSSVAEMLSKELGKEIDKKWISIDKPIKEVGLYDIQVKLPGGVKGVIKVELSGSEKI